jgi:Zn-dependent protease
MAGPIRTDLNEPDAIRAALDQIEASEPAGLRAAIEALPVNVRFAAYSRAVRQLVARMGAIDRLVIAVVLADVVSKLKSVE